MTDCFRCGGAYPIDEYGCTCRNRGEFKKRSNDRNNPARMWVGGKYIPTSDPRHVPGHYAAWGDVAIGQERVHTVITHQGRGLVDNLTTRTLLKEGLTEEQMNRGYCYVYLLQVDPLHYPETFKAGCSKEAPDSYILVYRRRLDVDHPNVENLYFTLIYKVNVNGFVIEQAVLNEMRRLGRLCDRREEIKFGSLTEARQVFSETLDILGGVVCHDDETILW